VTRKAIQQAIVKALTAMRQPLPMRLSEWAAEHFYLSAESSYVQGRWEAYPYQIGILDCMGHDDIREITLLKSARVGYTKMILAAIGYYAEHKRRNQAIWQPVDDDADEFVKTELDPMIRDVPAMQRIFPWYNSRSKHNTLRQKTFLSSMLHIRGGRSAKNYRRLSLDVAYLDELDGFEPDVESEGSPDGLASKRLEGATFPKLICGSTPRIADTSLITHRAAHADRVFRYHVACPHCQTLQPLEFGGKHDNFGLKWHQGQPETAAYLCAQCGGLFTQADYLQLWDADHGARWQDDEGVWFDVEFGGRHAQVSLNFI
jgi:phage terminase large subunit GpA-like protein